jgi:hypothetical protein
MRTIIHFILCVFFFINVVDLNAQAFSLQEILKMKQNQKYFESEMIKSDMTLVGIDEWNTYYYLLIGEEEWKIVKLRDNRDFNSIPTNDISKKNNNQYFYVEQKIKAIRKISDRVVTFAKDYNHQNKKGYSFFKHQTSLDEELLLDELVPYYSKRSNEFTITAPPNLYKYYLDQIISNFEFSRTDTTYGMGFFYEYFSKTTTQNQEKHRAYIVVQNDGSWNTIQLD